MKKYINIVGAFGLIVLLMAMPFFYGAIFLGSAFLDATSHVNPKSSKVEHNPSPKWEGMPKEEYQKIMKVVE
ncbi:hypothetical protein ACSS6N_12140 [Peribacillus frigoritolerans]|uniref:hypothetical protein n=1 Tax=Peribacillus frigoritolerans TaxID=450367 RepID=UPI003F86E05A